VSYQKGCLGGIRGLRSSGFGFTWYFCLNKRSGDAEGKVMTNEKLCTIHLLMLGGNGPSCLFLLSWVLGFSPAYV